MPLATLWIHSDLILVIYNRMVLFYNENFFNKTIRKFKPI